MISFRKLQRSLLLVLFQFYCATGFSSSLVANEMFRRVHSSLKMNPVGTLYINAKPSFRFLAITSKSVSTIELTGLISVHHTHSDADSRSVIKSSKEDSAGLRFGLSKNLLASKWLFDSLSAGMLRANNSNFKVKRRFNDINEEFLMAFDDGVFETVRVLFSPQTGGPELLSVEFTDRDKEKFLFMVD